MDWKHLLAYITGTVDQELLLRHAYLVTANRILRNQLQDRVRLSAGERQSLAAMGKKLGRQALAEMATIVKPDTILAWHRQLTAQKFDVSRQRNAPGRPPINADPEAVVVRIAQEHRSCGYYRIAVALPHLGYTISTQSVGNSLKRQGMPPAPERKHTTTWHDCIRRHLDVLVATDCFTTEVWTWGGLVIYDVRCVLRLRTREVHHAGLTPHLDQRRMAQIARTITMAAWGFLPPGHSLIHDRDGQFCPALPPIIDTAGVQRVPLPPRRPDGHAYAECWGRSVKEAALSRLIRFGERALRQALTADVTPVHPERPHQGQGPVVLLPAASDVRSLEADAGTGGVRRRQRETSGARGEHASCLPRQGKVMQASDPP